MVMPFALTRMARPSADRRGILRVGHVLEPGDGLAVEHFLHGAVHHAGGGAGAGGFDPARAMAIWFLPNVEFTHGLNSRGSMVKLMTCASVMRVASGLRWLMSTLRSTASAIGITTEGTSRIASSPVSSHSSPSC